MALDFVMSGGNLIASSAGSAPGIWSNAVWQITAAAPASSEQDTYAFTHTTNNVTCKTPVLPGVVAGVGYATLIAGFRLYLSTLSNTNNGTLILFEDPSGNTQC